MTRLASFSRPLPKIMATCGQDPAVDTIVNKITIRERQLVLKHHTRKKCRFFAQKRQNAALFPATRHPPTSGVAVPLIYLIHH
jgi:hypothetical protein